MKLPRWKILLNIGICIAAFWMAISGFASDDFRAKYANILAPAKLNLGLDLRGGSYLLLEVDRATYVKEQYQQVEDEIRQSLTKESLGYKDLTSASDFVSFTLREGDPKDKVMEVLKPLTKNMDTTDEAGKITLKYSDIYFESLSKDLLEQSIEIVRRRVDATGTREPIIQRQGEDRILLQVPGLENPDELKALIGTTAKMTFHLMNETDPFPSSFRATAPDELLLTGEEHKNKQSYYVIKKKPIITGDLLVSASPSYDDMQRPAVSFRFNSLGAKKFGETTAANIGKPFAIVLDGKVISAPVIQTAILGGSGIISGSFSTEEANNLSLLLRAGALPAPLKIIEERSVGPSLGADSIESGKKAFIIGFAFIAVMMVAFYTLYGFYSIIALAINMVLIFAVLSLFHATLTMPGIAGIILTMGMAVDANVLIFERMREEVLLGRSPIASVDLGFKNAYRTIMDSNVTTLAATLMLFLFGSGPIKGFAVTLSVGIICSMYSAVALTRMMVVLNMRHKTARPKR